MGRTKYNNIRIPDAINCGVSKEFTQIPTEFIRDPNISAKAKALLCLLLSNKKGWHSYINSIGKRMKEGKDAINTAIKELEELGYLLRFKYRSEKTQSYVGGFWAYTDDKNNFKVKNQILKLVENGMTVEVKIMPRNGNLFDPGTGFPGLGFPGLGNPQLIILNIKNILIFKNIRHSESMKKPIEKVELPIEKKAKKPTVKLRNQKYRPIARYLSTIVQSIKEIHHTKEQITHWTNDIRMLAEGNNIEPARIKTVLKWYSKNIGGEFIPVVESGKSLRDKFVRLEAAMQRESKSTQQTTKGSRRYYENPKTDYNKKTIKI